MPEHLPLNALRAFEAAARSGSFVAAGEELGVSSAAVSQQVKLLESTLNRTLFLRQGNRITLTDAGRTLFPRLETVFTELTAVTRDLRDGVQPHRLTVSALPSFAELWLLPALARYPARARINLRIEEDPVDFARSGADLRLTYGAHFYPGHSAEVLFRDRFIAVAAPSFPIGRHPAQTGFTPADLIHTDWGRNYIRGPDWSEWLEMAGLPQMPQPGLRLDSTLACVAAAQAGAGLALVPERLAQAAIKTGALMRIGETAVPMNSDYVLIHPHAAARKRGLQDFCQFLLAECQPNRASA